MSSFLTKKIIWIILSLIFLFQLIVNFLLGSSSLNFIAYTQGILFLIVFPIIVGKLSFAFFEKKILFYVYPIWVKFPIYWCLGNLFINIPAITTHLVKIQLNITTIFWFLVLIVFYSKFCDLSHDLSEKVKVIDFREERLKKELNLKFIKNNDFLVLSLAILANILFFGFWGIRNEFTSFNTDSLQNVHLANIFKTQEVYNLLAIFVSPQYTQVDYTTIITPNYALSLYFFDYRDILYLMFPFEVIVSCLNLIIRFNFFKELNIPKSSAAIIAFISCTVTFSGLYMSGTLYNQQVLVLCLPIIFYFIIYKEINQLIALASLLFLFHFTMSVFLFVYAASFLFFIHLEKGFFFKRTVDFLDLTKTIIVISLLILIIIESFFTYNFNYFLIQQYLVLFENKPQYLNTIGIYSNIAIMQIIMHGIGPIAASIIAITPILWMYESTQIKKWVYFIITIQLFAIIIPFPVANRTVIFWSLPFSLCMYCFCNFVWGKNVVNINVTLIFIIISSLLWSMTIRANDLDITGNYWNKPFLERDYQEFLKNFSETLTEKNIKPEDYQLVTEYFVKQHLESLAYKYDGNGVYEEKKPERLKNYSYLNNYESDSCEHYQRKYVIYILNERTAKWSRLPSTLAQSSSFAIWWGKNPNLIELEYIKYFQPKTSGTVVYDFLENNNRSIIVDCQLKKEVMI
jgi:hypothetical protein